MVLEGSKRSKADMKIAVVAAAVMKKTRFLKREVRKRVTRREKGVKEKGYVSRKVD